MWGRQGSRRQEAGGSERRAFHILLLAPPPPPVAAERGPDPRTGTPGNTRPPWPPPGRAAEGASLWVLPGVTSPDSFARMPPTVSGRAFAWGTFLYKIAGIAKRTQSQKSK